jgi:acetylglutamate kinase
MLLTNVRGILKNIEDVNTLISHVSVPEIDDLMKSKVISGGMIPKVNACIRALDRGVKKTHILDGKIPHGLLLEIFTDKGIGTEIVKR